MPEFQVTRNGQTLRIKGDRMPTEQELMEIFAKVSDGETDSGVQKQGGGLLGSGAPRPGIDVEAIKSAEAVAEPAGTRVSPEKPERPSIRPFLLPPQLTGDYWRKHTRNFLDRPFKEGKATVAEKELGYAGGMFEKELTDEQKDAVSGMVANAVEFLPGGEVTQEILSGLAQQPIETVIGFAEFFVDNMELISDLDLLGLQKATIKSEQGMANYEAKKKEAYDKLRHDPLYPIAAVLMLKGGVNKFNKQLKKKGAKKFLEEVDAGKHKIPEPKVVFDPITKQGELFKEKKPLDIKESIESQIQAKRQDLAEVDTILRHPEVKDRAKFEKQKQQIEAEITKLEGELPALSLKEKISQKDIAEKKLYDWIIKREKEIREKGGIDAISSDKALKRISQEIREGKEPKELNAIELLPKTFDRETGEILTVADKAWPRTGTLIDFIEGIEQKRISKVAKEVEVTDPLAKSAIEKFDRADQELKDARSFSARKVKDRLLTGVVDVSGNIKRELLKNGGELGKEAVITHDLVAGAPARAGQMLENASAEIYRSLNKAEHKQLDRIIQARTTISQTEAKGGALKSPITLEESKAFINSLPEKEKAKLMPLADRYFDIAREQLKELRDEGLITQEVFDSLIGRDYSRRVFIDYLDPKVPEGRSHNKISNRDSGIKNLKEGSESTLENNSQLLLTDLVSRTQSRIFRNRANKALWNLANEVPNNGIVEPLEVIRTTKSGRPVYQKPPHGYERIDALIDGQNKAMMMPVEMAKEWVVRDPLISQDIMNVAGWVSGSRILKPFATGINPEFALTNFPRDLAHIYLTTNEFSTNPIMALPQMARELSITAKDAFTRGARYKDYVNEGGGMEFLTHQGGGGFSRPNAGRLSNVSKYLGYLGETSEIWTRLALRQRALRNGATPTQATWIARNYLDFSQGGNVIKAIDSGVPYLNAGIQGTRGIVRAAKNNPKEFMQKASWIGAISTGLYLANKSTNPEVLDAIPEGQKARNFIITTPWSEEDSEGNTRYYYIAIPKDQGQRVMASAFEAIAAKALYDEQPSDQVLHSIRDFAPIIPTEFIPPTADAWFGYMANQDFWMNEKVWKGTKEEIEPQEEYYPDTHPFFVETGKITGLSPERMKFALSQYFTRGNIYTSLAGGTYKLLTMGMDEAEKEKTQKEFFAGAPFSRKMFKVTPRESKREENKEVIVTERTRRYKLRRELDSIVNQVFDEEADPLSVNRFIEAQPLESDRERLKDRSLNLAKLKGIPNRGYWLDLKNIPYPEVRAQQFWTFLNEKDNVEDKLEMVRLAYEVEGLATQKFNEKLLKLVLKTEPEMIQEEVVKLSNK